MSDKIHSISTKVELENIKSILTHCNNCGNCLYLCPVYNTELLEPDSPRGKLNLIKALIDNRIEPSKDNKRFLYHCLLCGSCEYICPQNVDFKKMMIRSRNLLTNKQKIPFFKKVFLNLYNKFFIHRFSFLINFLHKTYLRRYFFIPLIVKEKDKIPHPLNNKKYDILLFPGCGMDIFNQGILVKIYTFLNNSGYKVAVLRNAKCCGFPFLSQGWERKFNELREKNLKIIGQYDFKYLVIPCGSGVYTFRQYYTTEFEVFELTEFLYKYLRDVKINNRYVESAVTYSFHDPCHHLKSLNITRAPGHYLSQMGDQFIENKNETCCGFGGLFSIFYKKTSTSILKRKEMEFKKLGCNRVFTSCPGCYLYFKENSNIDIKHFIELF